MATIGIALPWTKNLRHFKHGKKLLQFFGLGEDSLKQESKAKGGTKAGSDSSSSSGSGGKGDKNGKDGKEKVDVKDLEYRQRRHAEHIDNIINDHLTAKDWSGTEAELRGKKIPKGNQGEYWNHINEMEDSLNGLIKAKKSLRGALKNPDLDPKVRRTLEEYVGKADDNIKKIYDLFNKYGYKPKRK